MSSLFGVPLDAAYHVISALVSVLTPLFGGFAAAAAIIAFTMAIRLLLVPLSYRAMRGLESQARIAPQVQALRQKHAANPERLQRELAALYQAEGTSMFAGCLPILVQWPFLSVLYLLFRSPTIGGQPNQLLTHDLLGAPLSSHWLSAGPFSAEGAVFVGLFAALAVIGWATARLARRTAPATSASPGLASSAITAATKITPYLTAVFAAFLPLAGGLYLVATTAWTLCERAVLLRFSASRSTASRSTASRPAALGTRPSSQFPQA
ncbi:MAG TPA: membrane protein insertase YidC [Streptosporangiaceae bacterium]|nr:membrane protein insertase YidC [Streptosporangiaceae bacterium]